MFITFQPAIIFIVIYIKDIEKNIKFYLYEYLANFILNLEKIK